MGHNLLLTGPPRSGKTTVVERTIDRLDDYDLVAGGVFCPEIREDGDRFGFEIVDVLTGESAILAHVGRESGPSVGRYRVDVENVDRISETAFRRAFEEADFLVVDEIAPMELYSETFIANVRRALDSERPVLAVVKERSTAGFIDEVKRREDVELFEVTAENRDDLPETLADWVRSTLDR